jgi:hypothetical protein
VTSLQADVKSFTAAPCEHLLLANMLRHALHESSGICWYKEIEKTR